jgi:hypothetical protein
MVMGMYTPLLLIGDPFNENETKQYCREDFIKDVKRFIKSIYEEQNICWRSNNEKKNTLGERDEENIKDEE